MKTTRHFFLLLFLCSYFWASAQIDGNLIWVQKDDTLPNPQMKTDGDDRAYGVDVDALGNIYTAGYYRDSVFVYKYRPDGTIDWELKISSTNSALRSSYGNSIVVSASAVYVVGTFIYGTTTASTNLTVSRTNGGPSTSTHNYPLAFIVKYNLQGGFVWARTILHNAATNPYANVTINDIDVDDSENVYITGGFSYPLNFTNKILSPNSCNVPSNYGNDIFIAKYLSSGSFSWARSVDFLNDARGNSISIDGNNVFVGGYFNGNLVGYSTDNTVAPSVCTASNAITNYSYSNDGVVLKYDLNGNRQWIKQVKSDASNGDKIYDRQAVRSVAAKNGSLYALLEISDQSCSPSCSNSDGALLYYISGTPYNYTPRNRYSTEVVLAKMVDDNSINFTVQWLQAINNFNSYSTVADIGNSLNIMPNNSVVGIFRSYSNGDWMGYDAPITTTVPSSVVVYPQTTSNSYNAGIASYSSTGNRISTYSIDGTGDEFITGTAFFGSAFYLAGFHFGTTNFNFRTPYQYRLSGSFYDAFLAKYDCPTTVLIPSKDTFCYGEVVTVKAQENCPENNCGFMYEWKDVVAGTTITSSQNPYSVNTTNLGSNQLIVKATEVNSGCISRDTFDFVVNPAVSVTVSQASAVICIGDSVSITASSTPSLGATYAWYQGSGTTPIGNSSTIDLSIKNPYTVVASVNGCKGSTNVNVDYFPYVDPKILPDTAKICANSGALLTVVDCPSCSYVWTPPPASSSSSTTRNIMADIPGTYFVAISDQYGCPKSRSKLVGVSSYLTPPIYANDANGNSISTICNGRPLVVASTPYDSCLTCTYAWNDGSTGPYTFAMAPGTYNVTVTDLLTGCRGTSSNLVIQSSNLATPNVLANPYNVCAPSNNGLLEVQNPCVGCSYSWYDNASPSFSIGTGITKAITTPGDYFVQVLGPMGCRERSSAITIGSDTATQPILTASTNTLCGSNSSTLTTINCAGCSYEWYYNDVTLIVGATTYQHITNTPGRYKVKVIYANSCYSTSLNRLLVTGTFTPQIGPPNPYICDGKPVDLSMTGSFSEPPYWSYQWYFNGSPISGSNGYIHTASAPGNYYVEVVNNNGCRSSSNIINVKASSAGANPVVIASPSIYRCGGTSIDLSALPCVSCEYTWKNANGTNLAVNLYPNTNYSVSVSQGYYVSVRDTVSNCIYDSPVLEIKDTILPTPIVNVASSTNICSTSPVILSTTACASCTYVWHFNGAFGAVWTDTVTQNTYSADTTGNYAVQVIQSGCSSPISSSVPVTRLPFTAQLSSPAITSICNSGTVRISALPNSTACPDCEYRWFRNGIQIPVPVTQDYYDVIQGGSYYAVVKQTFPGFSTTPYTFGCSATTPTVNFNDVSVSVNLRSSASAICGPSGQVRLTVDSCAACTYAWFFDGDTSVATGSGLNYVLLTGQNDTFYIVNGTAASGMYKVRVGLNGCFVYDSVYLPPVPALTYTYDTIPQSGYANICGNSPITLTAGCTTCSGYQWYLNGAVIPGAIGASYQAATGGDYQLIARDANGCITNSPITTVTVVNPPPSFVLNLDPVRVIPISYGPIHLDQYLFPSSVRDIGVYTSVPQPAAIVSDTFVPTSAGSGPHLVTYAYNYQNCTFRSTDTIEILQPQSLDVVNTNPVAPRFEACIGDSLRFMLTNFTFRPNRILFPVTATTYDTVRVSTAGLTQFAGVWSGTVGVRVPAGAITGKVILRDTASGTQYQADFFLVVKNPAVNISLNGVPQPLCSNLDTVRLFGFPSPGIFRAYYTSAPNTVVPGLISGDLLLLDSVQNYNPINGYQFLKLKYQHTPTYSNGMGACPTVYDSITVQVNNVELDSIEYTPISVTETSIPMATLTRLIWPLANRSYPGTYTGTYVSRGDLLASTLPFVPANNPPAMVSDPVIYQFSNGICKNSVTENVDVWRAPTILDSIPSWLCRNADTIFIGRNGSSLYLEIGSNTYLLDSIYAYQHNNPMMNPGDFAYDEFINKMTITSSNGGLFPMSLVAGFERYAFVPTQVSGPNTSINLSFAYERYHTYFTPLTSSSTTIYTIARKIKTINIEDPIAAQINPAILANPIFCQSTGTQQFSGIPNGGQYYLNGSILNSNIFNPTNEANIHGPGAQTLTYVYRGNACSDSISTTIIIPDTFSIQISTLTGPDYCRLDAPDNITVTTRDTGIINQSAGLFYVNNVLSGQVFNPAVAPAIIGANAVVFIASDTFGCQSSYSTTFNVFEMPNTAWTQLDSTYCLNNAAVYMNLSESNMPWSLPSPYTTQTVSLTGRGIVNGGTNPTNPYYLPDSARVGLDTIIYIYTDVNGCTTTKTQYTRIKPLPILSMTTTGGMPMQTSYCERDTVPVYGWPNFGATVRGFYSESTTNPAGSNLHTALNPVIFAPNIPGFSPANAVEVIAYHFTDSITGCSDTLLNSITIRNFTTDVTIDSLPVPLCADDTIYVLNPNMNGGPSVTSTGVFGAFWVQDAPMIVDSILGHFNPYRSGIYDTGRDVIVTYSYQSNGCSNTIYDTMFINPLPQLSFNMPGDTLSNSDSPIFHVCFSASPVFLQPYNQYNGSNLLIPQTAPQGIGGTFSTTTGRGVYWDNAFTHWDYIPDSAIGGLDTIILRYTDQRGCTGYRREPIIVDTVPELGFAGFDPMKYDTASGRFVYCQNDPASLIIPSPFGGATYWNYQNIPSILFELRPDTLVVGGVTTIHRLTYEFISARYHSGGVCIDSTIQFVEVRPTPILTLAASVPSEYCVSNPAQRLPLSATPRGGIFEDITVGAIAGVIPVPIDSFLFNPMAQLGRRTIIYRFTDTISGCTDTLTHIIDVYNLPKVSFISGGGCQGDPVVLIPGNMGLNNSFPARDSITMAIWTYGDGQADTIRSFANPVVVPQQSHVYTQAGVYFPRLTISNRGRCDTSFTRRIVVSPKFTVRDTIPYTQDFQLSAGNWFQENGDTSVNVPSDSLWHWGMANGSRITTVQFNNKVWVTRANGPYNQNERAWVYSPCFDISTLDKPMVALDIWRDTRDGVDGAVMQYFDNNSQQWKTLGVRGKGLKWYTPPYVISAPGYQVGAPIGWSGSSGGWEDARYRLDVSGNDLRGTSNLRLRLAFSSSPNSVIAGREGFAFDNFYLGNRTRAVLLEHFTNQSIAGIATLERDLYRSIYNNLYGRDVSLIQYHTNYGPYDFLHQASFDEANARVLHFNLSTGKQARINGGNLASTTDSLVYNALELLDMEMLRDAKFKIKLFPTIIQNNEVQVSGNLTALKDQLYDEYRLQVVVTEDSIVSLQNHKTMAVMRKMMPDAAGIRLAKAWVTGETVPISQSWSFNPATYNPNNLQVVVFIENKTTKEVFQVATSRNLSIFNGPVAIEELEAEDGIEIIEVKIFPNPAQSYFNVAFDQALLSEYEWRLVDVTGRVLRRGVAMPGTQQFTIETDGFSPGMYIFSINNETVYTQRKLIIAK